MITHKKAPHLARLVCWADLPQAVYQYEAIFRASGRIVNDSFRTLDPKQSAPPRPDL